MPRLPTREDLGPAPSLRPSGPLVGGRQSNIGTGLAALGKGVAELGVAFEREDRFDAERRFTEFAYDQERSYSESVKSAQPGASGFRDNVIGGYQSNAKKFLKTVPDHLKADYDGKLLDFETRLSRSSDGFETKERERFASEGVVDSHNKLALLVEADPNNYEKAAESSKVLLDNAPVDEITRETLRKKYGSAISKAAVEGILKAGGTEDDVKKFIQRIEPKGPSVSYAPGTTQGKIAQNVSNAPLALAIAERESSFKHDARSSKTIRGLFQMDAATRAKYGLAEDASEEDQAKAFDQEIQSRGAELEKQIGRKPTSQELYFAWHFGAKGAAELLNSDPNKTTKDWVFETFGDRARAVWDQNKHIRDAKTVGGLIENIGGDIDKRIAKYGGPPVLSYPDAGGVLEKGNINLNTRPSVKLDDGSVATIRSMSVNFDGKEVLIPTVSDSGKILSEDEAIAQYQKTGRHLGKFKTPEDATAYGKLISKAQGTRYGAGEPTEPSEIATFAQTRIIAHRDALERRQRALVMDEERAVRIQERQKKDASDAEEVALMGVLADPAKNAQVTALSIAQNPRLTREAVQRMTAMVDRADKTDNTYGAKFYELFQRIHLPEGDENRLNSLDHLVPFVSQNGGLKLSGYNELVRQLQGKNTPEGEAESKMLSQFLKAAHQELSGTNPMIGIKDPKGEEINLRFMAQVLPLYYKLRGQGKTASQLLDPDSPEYLGKGVKVLKRPYNEQVRDMLGGLGGEADTSTQQGLITAVQSGKISRAEGEKIAIDRGWIRPTVQAPISR